jgi:hypothetical protein
MLLPFRLIFPGDSPVDGKNVGDFVTAEITDHFHFGEGAPAIDHDEIKGVLFQLFNDAGQTLL